MAADLRRFTDMHPLAIMVTVDLSEPAIIRETKNRCIHGGHSLRESRSPAWTPSVRDPDTDSTK